jgi:hypothetical protein
MKMMMVLAIINATASTQLMLIINQQIKNFVITTIIFKITTLSLVRRNLFTLLSLIIYLEEFILT